MKASTALKLGRSSNLPTVWTNVLAATVLAGGRPELLFLIAPLLATSLFYIGGMFLNDAFDAELDAVERPERPIPAGEASFGEVLTWGFVLLGAGMVTLLVHVLVLGSGGGWWPLVAGFVTILLIVVYDVWHKDNPVAPVIMGLCRVGVYAVAALCVADSLPPDVLFGAALLLGYVLGLTYVARYEDRSTIASWWPLATLFAPLLYTAWSSPSGVFEQLLWCTFLLWLLRALALLRAREAPNIKRAVVSFIAGISLLDALLIARLGSTTLALFALVGFGLTLVLQRRIAGT